jgi:hypothetical protein
MVRRPLMGRLIPLVVLVSACGLGCSRTAKLPPKTEAPELPASTDPTVSAPEPCGLPKEIREPHFPLELGQTSAGEPARFDPAGLTLAVLPDTQYYVACRSEHLKRQAAFVEKQAGVRNIIATLTLGDLTDHNSAEEWLFFRENLGSLPDRVPFLLVTGNHDHGKAGSADRRETKLADYFSLDFVKSKQLLAATERPADLENAYYRFPIERGENGSLRACPEGCKAPLFTLGVLALGWSPNERSVEWAKKTLSAYPKDRRILVTHAYLYDDGTRYDFRTRGTEQKWNPLAYWTAREGSEGGRSFDGEMLWEALVRDDPGFFLTLSGHVLGRGAARLTSEGAQGNLVHQVLANYQMLREGGLGYLRLLELSRDGAKLAMRTYSPSLHLSSHEPEQEFTLPISPPLFRAQEPLPSAGAL